jgi:hypothetical protein
MIRFSKKKYRNKNKNFKTRKNGSRRYKTRRNKKGGLLWNPSMTVAGVNLSSSRGEKQYNWKTGKWDEYVCYGVGPLKGCQLIPAK